MKLYVFKLNKRVKITFPIIVSLFIVAALLYSPDKVITAFQVKREIPIYSVDHAEKKASITFDCAWGNEDIPDILNTLKVYNVKATFFIVGAWAERYPDSVRRISEEGHDIANHSYSHSRMAGVDKQKIKNDIAKCTKVLEEITGKKCDLFRPSYGEYDNNVIRAASELGLFSIQWNVDSLDWRPDISQAEILNRINGNVKPGSIILLHNDTANTSKILPTIITSLKEKGYELVPVSELIMRDNYWIDFDGRQKKQSDGSRVSLQDNQAT